MLIIEDDYDENCTSHYKGLSDEALEKINRGIAMVIVIQAVLILSMVTGGIGEQGTVSILSAIVGYMLGRKE